MPTSTTGQSPLRDIHFMANPALWPAWPYLPLVRRTRGELECGLLFDAQPMCSLPGLRTTVFFATLLLPPPTLEQFLALPREVFGTPEEVYAAGWRVD